MVERLPGISKDIVHEHEESAELATVLLSCYGVFALGALIFFRKRTSKIPRSFTVVAFLLALVPAGAMALTANQGGAIRHSEIHSGSVPTAAAAGDGSGTTDDGMQPITSPWPRPE